MAAELLKDGRQRCRRINVYANVLEGGKEEQTQSRRGPRGRLPLCAPSDRFERESIVGEKSERVHGAAEAPLRFSNPI